MHAQRFDALPRAFDLGARDYYLDFTLVPVAAAVLIAIAILQRSALGLAAMLVVLGIVAWTLAEYLIHRFAFHELPALRPMHDVHHARPKDYIGIASWGVFAAMAVVWTFAALAAGVGMGCAFTAGVLLGYLFYIVIHDRFHHGNRAAFGRYVKFMERYHAGHHRGGETNFGVSSPIWDFVFRTYRAV